MVLRVTKGAYEQVEDLAAGLLPDKLRGSRWTFSRPGESRRNKVRVEFHGVEQERSIIPAGLDVVGILYRCWGIPRPKVPGMVGHSLGGH